eukprot:CAMPEP_0117537094 /NCGR_PEP_ID=MMETSP0784-20121206/41789_1 /TAXON_ID=39447 /ORGANISM="" /LENGTH=491 /DNA_ID=CAMNT_0005333673 /DNA_START=18 /DNA_END=1493 /DNA_ORIENTATION=-
MRPQPEGRHSALAADGGVAVACSRDTGSASARRPVEAWLDCLGRGKVPECFARARTPPSPHRQYNGAACRARPKRMMASLRRRAANICNGCMAPPPLRMGSDGATEDVASGPACGALDGNSDGKATVSSASNVLSTATKPSALAVCAPSARQVLIASLVGAAAFVLPPLRVPALLSALAWAVAAWYLGNAASLVTPAVERPADAGDDRDLVDLLRGCLLPGGTWIRMSPNMPTVREDEYSFVRGCGLVRPTNSPHAESEYRYKWHFDGRRRLWEFRMQIQFRQVPEDLYFGIEVDAYRPMTGSTRMAYSVLKRFIYAYFGRGFYHSSGDDPEGTTGEAEPPTFAVPLWGFDQVIVSPKGKEPNLLGKLDGLGFQRSNGMSKFRRELDRIVKEISIENVYTFCFWGPSRYADICHWEISGLPGGMKFPITDLAGPLPFTMVLYDLGVGGSDKASKGGRRTETRHLRSRKRYYFQAAVWHQDFCAPPAGTSPS